MPAPVPDRFGPRPRTGPRLPAPARPLLSVEGLTRRLGDRNVLDGVDLHLDLGEVVAVLGPNGSGKTTLLRCVVGLDQPTSGVVELAGRPVRDDVATRRLVASVLDDVDFFPDLSLAEHLALLLLAHGLDGPDQRAAELLDEAGLGTLAGRLPATLSSGQRRRLALLTCFARPRLLVVADEPEQRLDRAARRWLVDRLQREKDLGHGVLVATHDPELVGVADRTVTLGGTG